MAFALGPQARSAGYAVMSLETAGSTNVEAMAHLKAGGSNPVWFVTDHQVAGRGRRNRVWVSPKGNLAASVGEVIDIAPAQAATLGFAAGVALATALRQFGVSAKLKWPNDALLEGAKLSGMSLEAESVADGRLAVVVGIGVNVVAAPQGLPYAAASLHDAGCAVSAEELFEALAEYWSEMRMLWDNGRGMPVLRQRWLVHAAGIGGPVTIQAGTRTVSGIFETIDETGHMIVITDEGRRVPIASGEVFFGDAATSAAGAV
ncbi:MAG: biotin--[acetyl-CoA-carboxylase] ligase [Xanthobacteraceae bacterium]